MITSVFSKSKPINFILITSVLFLCFALYQFRDLVWTNSVLGITEKIIVLITIIASIFITNFVTKKNRLSKDSCFAFLFFSIFFLLFPSVFINTKIVISNFFILLALRRLIALHSLIAFKEKIFDASFWIFTAIIFHFWSILFILLVFISIVSHAYRDYRNWIIPFIALFTVIVLYISAALIFDKTLIFYILDQVVISFDFDYFEDVYQNVALVFFTVISLFFTINQVFSFSKKPINIHASYKKVIYAFFTGVLIFIISTDKNNSYLIYTFAPLAIMGATFIENLNANWAKNILLYILIGVSCLIYISQLQFTAIS